MTAEETIQEIAETNALGAAATPFNTERREPTSGETPDPDDEETRTTADVEMALGFDPAKETP